MAQCFCIIRHARTASERKAVKKSLDLARSQGDSRAMMFLLASLTGKCPPAARACAKAR